MSGLLQELVTRQAERSPDSTAVVLGEQRLSYAYLEQQSSRLARVLRDRGVERGSRVCILLPKVPAAIVGLLGVLKAGGSYVPLDPAGPAARVDRILRSCDDRFLLTSAESAGLATELVSRPPASGEWCIGWLGRGAPPELAGRSCFSLDEVEQADAAMPLARGAPDDLAYIMFTSGSTGAPKGVTITHANVRSFLDWSVPYFGLGPDDRCSAHPPLHFDLSVFDIFGSLTAGAELHLVPRSLNLLPGALARFIRDSDLTQWFSVPSALNYMMSAECVAERDFPALRRLLWCGEVLPTPTLVYLMRRLPHVAFTNLYGPTETTIASGWYTVPRIPEGERADVPIGTACAGEEMLVLDENLRAVPTGELGDLYIAGAGLSPGYWRDPEKTQAAFVDLRTADGTTKRIYRTGDLARVDEEGRVHYVGRADAQIKSRGYRIELGEIEAALHTLDEVEQVAVVAVRSRGFEGWTICCAYMPTVPGALDGAGLAAKLRALLPGYMLPQRWLELDRLPTNVNGKLDRPRLKEAFEAEGQPVP